MLGKKPYKLAPVPTPQPLVRQRQLMYPLSLQNGLGLRLTASEMLLRGRRVDTGSQPGR